MYGGDGSLTRFWSLETLCDNLSAEKLVIIYKRGFLMWVKKIFGKKDPGYSKKTMTQESKLNLYHRESGIF